jgi:polyferredoxin
MQMLFGWISPVSLRLKMDTTRIAECTDCKGCEKVCFMNVVPRRNNRDISCVNCGACIDACNRELSNGLFYYSFGSGKIEKLKAFPKKEGGFYGNTRPQEIDKILS